MNATLTLRLMPEGARLGKCLMCASHVEGKTVALCVNGRAVCPRCADEHVQGLSWLLGLAAEAAACFPNLPTEAALDRIRDILAGLAEEERVPDADELH